MKTEQREDGILYAVAGASRMGKTAWVKQRIAGAQRLIIRDPRMEYVDTGARSIDSVAALASALREVGTGAGKFAYTGPDSGFNDFARLAYLWCQLWPCVVVAEEISDVTNPGKAPDGWGQLIRKGLYYGAHIYSITQRPAECDKTVWGNATVIHMHGFILPIDCEYMAKVMGLPADQIAHMEPLTWVERRAGSRELTSGRVEF